MMDAVEALRQHTQEEAPDELVGAIEHALRELLEQRGVAVAPGLAIASMIQMLEELNLMPIAKEFAVSVRVLASPTRGQSAGTVQQTCSTAQRLLAELQKLIRDFPGRAKVCI